MADTLIKVDLTQSPTLNENIHNRWHPDIPMACWVNPGDEFILETSTGPVASSRTTIRPMTSATST